MKKYYSENSERDNRDFTLKILFISDGTQEKKLWNEISEHSPLLLNTKRLCSYKDAQQKSILELEKGSVKFWLAKKSLYIDINYLGRRNNCRTRC